MNIFLDSNILFEDYFFENKSNGKILEYAKSHLIKLFMSDIVRLELRWQFLNEIKLKNREIKKINKDFKRLGILEISNIIDYENQLKRFDDFYSDLSTIDNFNILPYKNDFLPDIVKRAIERKKPFAENKTELKDAIIWKTYSEYVEENQLDDCILLTNNTNDFCTKGDNSIIHPDLQVDSSRFLVINSSFLFLKLKSNIIETPERKLQAFMEHCDFDHLYVYSIVNDIFKDDVISKVNDELERTSPNSILDSEYWVDGYLSGNSFDISDCDDAEYEILSDRVLISGMIFVDCDTDVYQYNPSRDSGDEQFSCICQKTITFEVYFNFDMNIDEEVSEFEITQLKINSIN